jgi:Transglycosylase SLT domain
LCLICWAVPVKLLAKTIEPQEQLIVFPNYAKHREVSKAVEKPAPAAPHKQKPRTKQPSVPAPQGTYSGRSYSKAEVEALIRRYADEYKIPAQIPLCIAYRESGYNQFSANKTSSARGVFQYLAGTWRATDEGKSGLSVFDAEANVRAAVKYMASRKSTSPWVVGKSCPHF